MFYYIYKQITTIAAIEDIKLDGEDYLELTTRDKLVVAMRKKNLTAGQYIIEEGRIICLVSDQPTQGRMQSMYVRTETRDFSDDGFFKKHANYIMNPKNRLEGIPGFVLAFER